MKRKDMPRAANGDVTVCCWATKIVHGNPGEDEVCGVKTKRFWDPARDCYTYRGLCAAHQEHADEQDRISESMGYVGDEG